MKKTTLFFASAIISFCASAQSFTALYPFDSVKTTSGTTDPTPLPTATGAIFGSFMATGTPPNPNATGRFSFTDWSLGALNGETIYANLTGSASTTEYYEVTIAPSGAYTLSLSNIAFTFTRSGTGVRTYSVRSDADGYAANLPASITPANLNLSVQTGDIFFLNTDITSNQIGSTITLSGAAFTNISVARTFRFYGWNAEGTGGTYSIDNVSIVGTATAPAFLNASFSATSVCLGNATVFTDLSTGPNTIVSWLWDFGDGTGTSTLPNPSYTYAAPGIYTVSLIVIDNMAATDNYIATVSVYNKPVASFSAPTSVCAGTVVQFLDGSTILSGSITGWDWNFGDPASGINNTSLLQNPQHIYYTQMMYTATEIVTSDMGCKDTVTISMSVDSIGVSYTSLVSGPTVTFTGNVWGGNPAYAFMWDFGDASSPDMTLNPIHTYSSPGTYIVCFTATDVNGCSDQTCSSVVIITVGIDGQHTDITFNITPNPSSNGIFTLNTVKASVRIYNILGNMVLAKEIVQSNNIIDLSDQANGSYFVVIQTEKESITKKLIINK